MTVLRFYVAGPYTEDPEACTAEAIRVGNLILDLSHAPFVPHLSHYWHALHGQRHYEDWMRIDLAWLRAADFVVRIPGHSPGADRECELAQSLGITVMSLCALELEHIERVSR